MQSNQLLAFSPRKFQPTSGTIGDEQGAAPDKKQLRVYN